MSIIEDLHAQEIAKLRPQLLNLVECNGFSDNSLNSAIGGYDGYYTEKLFQSAAASKLNDYDTLKGFKEYI